MSDYLQVACDNSPTLVTMSGTYANIHLMLDSLKKSGKFARLLDSGNRAFHSSLVKLATPKFALKLKKIISGNIIRQYDGSALVRVALFILYRFWDIICHTIKTVTAWLQSKF